MDIRFITSNPHKIREVKDILSKLSINVIPLTRKLSEIQTIDDYELVKAKLLDAFKQVGRNVLVEHTGLYIEEMNNFPGGLTQIFWDNLKADRFCEIFGNLKNPTIMARTTLGYCDSKDIHFFNGEIKGKISPKPMGNRDFQWDCIFIPDGQKETFAEMGDKKNDISMRRIALNNFADFLKKI